MSTLDDLARFDEEWQLDIEERARALIEGLAERDAREAARERRERLTLYLSAATFVVSFGGVLAAILTHSL